MEYEVLNQGEPERDEPTSLSPLGWIAIALVCVLVGVVFLVFRGAGESVSGPVPTTRRAPGFSAMSNPGQNLDLGRICPAVTDGRTTLAVSFTLVNVSHISVTVMDVEPVLPIGGLRPRGANTAGGTCEDPGMEAPGGLLHPGATQLITMRFRLPKECPQPFPVQARVRLRVNQMVGTTTVAVYSDLGSVDFDRCPDPA